MTPQVPLAAHSVPWETSWLWVPRCPAAERRPPGTTSPQLPTRRQLRTLHPSCRPCAQGLGPAGAQDTSRERQHLRTQTRPWGSPPRGPRSPPGRLRRWQLALVLPGESRRRCDCQGLKLLKHGRNARQEALHANGKHHAPPIGTTKPTSLPWTRSFSIHLPRQSAKKTFPPNMSQRDDCGRHPQHPVLFSTHLQGGKSLHHPLKHRSATYSCLPGSQFTDGMHMAFRKEELNRELHLP